MEKQKVLISYATYGSGHKTVANYIYDYLQKNSNYEIKIIDLMDYENIIGYISKTAFENNFKHKVNSIFFSIIYKFFDYKATTIPYKQVTKSIFKNKKLKEDIIKFNPDLLISTHFFGNIIVGELNKKGLTKTKIISVITDYVSHEMWLKDEKNIDAFIVSNDIVKKELTDKKINAKKIYSYGIPISEKFRQTDNITKIKDKYHVNNSNKTFLFFAGGSIGASFTFNYLKQLLERQYNINIIFVCGKNEELKSKTERYIKKYNYKNIIVLGFSREVNNLLNICDVVITKPGGISITESLEMKKTMILIPGNGGNEIYNAKFVCKNGYGIKCRTPKKLAKIVGNILSKDNILNNMKRKLTNYDDNKSIEKIYKLCQKILKK